MNKQKQQLILMLLIGVFVGIAIVTGWKSGVTVPREESLNTTSSGVTTTDMSRNTGASRTEISQSDIPFPSEIPSNIRVGLSVPDQTAGNSVTVSSLNVIRPQWIAVYDDSNGHPGWIMGASRAHEGDASVTVELLRQEGTIAGQTYYVAILNDDGDDTFNRLTDLPPLSSENVIIVKFKAK